jgi:hypothetical protein
MTEHLRAQGRPNRQIQEEGSIVFGVQTKLETPPYWHILRTKNCQKKKE